MDSSDEGKLFVGGIPWDTTEDTLRDHFTQYGDVSQVVIMRDKSTGRPRGFAFVVFSDPSLIDAVLQDQHTIDGRTVEAKRALSREEQQTSSKSGYNNAGRGGSNGDGNFKTKKIFVGGLPADLTEEGFREYFENYGSVNDVVIMFDQQTQRPRGFGFITFDSEDAVDRVLQNAFHDLNGKLVEVKRALPKDANPGGGGRGGGYQDYGASGDGNRYVQSHPSAGMYPPYTAYGAPPYGFGAANSGVAYGGYANYGVGGYGGAPPGPYGMPGLLKNSWDSQVPSGYGASGYGAAATWGGSSASAPMSQPSSAGSGYGGYGFGNYGGSDGSGYGAARGRTGNASNNVGGSGNGVGEQHGSGGGYSDGSRNSGYGNEAWRSDLSQASGGYNSSRSRHAQH